MTTGKKYIRTKKSLIEISKKSKAEPRKSNKKVAKFSHFYVLCLGFDFYIFSSLFCSYCIV